MPLLPNEKKALNALKNILVQKYNILDFRIYGSKATDTDLLDSDKDHRATHPLFCNGRIL